ncbi:hypothetical protein PFLG_00989 [Plasmodium falciparum RAJ116]|uniref:Dynein heavy chain linker domain-containing protein n=1 Tax=Plasmodium falciparum RAJ116 TaxID=580058 RepID=A0A0L0CWN4_PLAFA|nr:hypothetical protein PFLG_00989 [Plasmodium falciparum RAJ116]
MIVKRFENSYILEKINNNNYVRDFLHIQKQLNYIEKSLDTYLDQKKRSFPRFYFLSNKEILEILGMYKNPFLLKNKIQNIFSAVCSIEFVPSEKRTTPYQKNNSIVTNIMNEYNKGSISLATKKNYQKNLPPYYNNNNNNNNNNNSNNIHNSNIHNSNNNIYNSENKDRNNYNDMKNYITNISENNMNMEYVNYSSHFDIYILSQHKERIKLHKKMLLNYESSTIILKKLEENIYEL